MILISIMVQPCAMIMPVLCNTIFLMTIFVNHFFIIQSPFYSRFRYTKKTISSHIYNFNFICIYIFQENTGINRRKSLLIIQINKKTILFQMVFNPSMVRDEGLEPTRSPARF